jgi:glycyl-tRNA synthetase beta subunit
MLDGNNAKIAKERFNDGNFIMDKERIAKAKEFIEIAITFFNSLGTKKNKISSIRFRVLNKIWQLE